jgi:hypothetical protein
LLQAIDQLQLIGLVCEDAASFIGGDDFFLEIVMASNDLPHALFDHFQIFRGEGTRQVKIIIETILNRGPDGELTVGEHLQDCLGHDMRRRVADAVKIAVFVSFLLFFRHDSLLKNKKPSPTGARAYLTRFHPDLSPMVIIRGLISADR